MSGLYQFELGFDPLNDRMVLRIYTKDFTEFRLWLTRRFVKALWGVLLKLLDGQNKDSTKLEAEKQRVSESFDDENARKQQSLASKYSTKLSKTPLGPDPILVSRIAAKPTADNRVVLSLQDEKQQSFDLVLDKFMLLGLCKLLSEGVKKTDWDLNLTYDQS
jgi:hypothetical protein